MDITVAVLGDVDIMKELGKGGTTNDIEMRNLRTPGGVFTFVAPVSDRRNIISPKIQVMAQAAAMADVHVISAVSLTPSVGEAIILLDEMRSQRGFFIAPSHMHDALRNISRETSLKDYGLVSSAQELAEKLSGISVERDPEGSLLVPVDNCFDVRGVGTVVLGLVKRGTLKQYDKLMLYPSGKEISVKSIQCQDVDVKSAGPGSRVGLAIKGAGVEDVSRGCVISGGKMEVSGNLAMDFSRNSHSKHALAENKAVICVVGLQAVSGKITCMSPFSVSLEGSVAYERGGRCLVVSQDRMPRIVGSGVIKIYSETSK
ncbi:MAG: hypothetical protein HYT73_04015 [Candidatus Aenigmarchaeota archaeon]|nr:hypothetical protein [Candidatus Aenigmarchaeota archaeon]